VQNWIVLQTMKIPKLLSESVLFSSQCKES